MLSKKIIASVWGTVFVLSFGIASAASALTVSCTGTPSATAIAWTSASSGGVAPIALLWGNNSTAVTQTVSVSPGTYTMTLQGTDASSTVATTTCVATVAAPTPTTSVLSDLDAQIKALMDQINALKAQLATLVSQRETAKQQATASTTGNCFNFNRDLHKGDEGDDVKELQRTLSGDASLLPPGLVTGHFGPRTEEAMKKYQEKFGISGAASTTTGFFGPKTRKHFNENCGKRENDRKENKHPEGNRGNGIGNIPNSDGRGRNGGEHDN